MNKEYKSDKDPSTGQTAASEATESDKNLDTFPQANEGPVRLQLSVTEETASPMGSSDAKESKVEMYIKKATFQTQDLVLQETLQEQWDQCKEAVKIFPYFDTLDDIALRECFILSKIKRYETDKIILGNSKGKQNSVYFILKGQCEMIQHMELAMHKINGRKYFRLVSRDLPLRPNEQLEVHFMQVCLMNKGECFNIGENLEDRNIITTTEVECMVCPYHWLMQNSKANIWEKIKHFLDMYLPTKEKLFKEFKKHQRWLDYREGLVKDILKKDNIRSSTTVHDVPYSIRIKEGIKLYSQ